MLALLALTSVATAFCGTYVGPADGTPSNGGSRLVVVHESGGTVLTMTSDAQDAGESFGLLMPVPAGLDQDAIEVVTDTRALEALDAFTAPRLVSYTCDSLAGDFGAIVTESCNAQAEGCTQASITDAAEEALLDFAGVEVQEWVSKGVYQFAIVRADDAGALTRWLDASASR